ncbi:MAG: hypothetical protein AAF160_20795 [Pseudomonadota bacterium]
MFRCCSFLVFFALLPAVAHANFTVIDKRVRTESLDYRIAFCSRLSDGSSFPTHAFVVYTRAVPNGEANFMLATGWAPAAGSKYTTDAVVGAFSQEILTDRSQTCVPVLVNSDVWESALNSARAMNFEEVLRGDIDQLADGFLVYRLLESDCITFIQSIARQIGLAVPDRGLKKPVEYIPELAKANGS